MRDRAHDGYPWRPKSRSSVFETNMSSERVAQISRIFVRFALGSAFLSAIADRFGVYGPPGSKYVGFGDWSSLPDRR
jgi:hypothetical protein